MRALLLAFVVARAPFAVAASGDGIALHCRFASGLRALYIIEPNAAAARRVDLRTPRTGRLETTAAEYRLVFEPGDGRHRIELVLDRATANVRRVFGTRAAMARMPFHGPHAPRLVRDAGQCRAQSASLRPGP